jgi:apolipoprotein D and lipocalin family protein
MRRLLPALALVAAVTGLSACQSAPVGNTAVPQPVKAVALDRYLGRWYEFARYENPFEHNCAGVTADYSLRPDGSIKVLNACHKGAPNGPANSATGRAKTTGDRLGAKLKVSFFGPFFADYWVLDHADDYSWSIVGEPSGRYLWVLTRKPVLAAEEKDALIQRVKAMGYDLKLLSFTPQS